MKVTCINDKGRPNEIPLSKWIKKDQEYTVLKMMKCNTQGGLLGFELAEIDLTGCNPYLYFAANRFAPLETVPEEEIENLEEILL
jgi:hypothetical protein